MSGHKDEQNEQWHTGSGFYGDKVYDSNGSLVVNVFNPILSSAQCRKRARLISAAPAMLAALISLRDEQSGPPLYRREKEWKEAMRMAD